MAGPLALFVPEPAVVGRAEQVVGWAPDQDPADDVEGTEVAMLVRAGSKENPACKGDPGKQRARHGAPGGRAIQDLL